MSIRIGRAAGAVIRDDVARLRCRPDGEAPLAASVPATEVVGV